MQHLAELRIDLGALTHNLNLIRSLIATDTHILAMVKADAYGHGAVTIASHLETLGVHIFGVAKLAEAIQLRQAGIKARLVVLQPEFQLNAAAYQRWQLECCINGLADLAHFQSGARVPCHLFVDTGMGREGALPEEALACVDRLQNHPVLHWVGLATHFATADEADLAFAHHQLQVFESLLENIPQSARQGVQIHAANSGAILNLPQSHFHLVRPGILLYGQYSGATPVSQKPVMSVFSRVNMVKTLPKGHSIGYGSGYFTKSRQKVAVLGLGYGDGFSWYGAGDAKVLIGGRFFPVVGRASMDQIAVAVDETVGVGDEAQLYHSQSGIDIVGDARRLGTIAYERLCQLGMRLPKVYLNS